MYSGKINLWGKHLWYYTRFQINVKNKDTSVKFNWINNSSFNFYSGTYFSNPFVIVNNLNLEFNFVENMFKYFWFFFQDSLIPIQNYYVKFIRNSFDNSSFKAVIGISIES